MMLLNKFLTLAVLIFSLLIIIGNSLLKEVPVRTIIGINKSVISDDCHFRNNPEILKNEPGSFLQFWVEENRPVFHDKVLPESESLHEFRNQIEHLLDTDPMVLLRNQRAGVTGGDDLNVELVLRGEAGKIREISCLEGILLSVQTDRSVIHGNSMYAEPTEFFSYILERGEFIKIYYYTVDQPGIRGLSVFTELLDQDMEDGWKVSRNIHNHNFFPQSEMVLGGVVPSTTDIEAFRNTAERFDMPSASITNGFHTLDISHEDFMRFSNGNEWE